VNDPFLFSAGHRCPTLCATSSLASSSSSTSECDAWIQAAAPLVLAAVVCTRRDGRLQRAARGGLLRCEAGCCGARRSRGRWRAAGRHALTAAPRGLRGKDVNSFLPAPARATTHRKGGSSARLRCLRCHRKHVVQVEQRPHRLAVVQTTARSRWLLSVGSECSEYIWATQPAGMPPRRLAIRQFN
jgi:hypothetical protein